MNTSLAPVITYNTKAILSTYKNEVREELDNILDYWMSNTHDGVNGGFIGRVNEHNQAFADAPKGAVLNSRILWAFSSAYQVTNNPQHLHLARVAFNYLNANFIDKQNGGVYWTVDAQGQPLDTKKQVYALAFAIYGCSAYYQVSKSEAAKNTAIELYKTIEAQSFDTENSGYFEAFTRNWQQMEDLRLSAKDANEKKTMNTHLHILEAYTSLYQIWPDEKLKEQINNLIKDFIKHIVDSDTGHLVLFFDEQWNPKSTIVSYGHDIEAAWLLLEAAEVVHSTLLEEVKKLSLKISLAATKGLDKDGGLWYEYQPATLHLIKEKHWWVQAEAMVGFLNAWQLSNKETYLQHSLNAWQYTKEYIKDNVYGEWLWGRTPEGQIMPIQDKVGIWKCPYHNTRACIEILKRL